MRRYLNPDPKAGSLIVSGLWIQRSGPTLDHATALVAHAEIMTSFAQNLSVAPL